MPLQTLVEDGIALAVPGTSLTIIDVVVAVVLPQMLVAVNVYMPADAVLTVMAAGFW